MHMGFLSWMFGTPKAFEKTAETVGKTIDWVGKGVDAAWYTDEEKAADLKASQKDIRDMILKLQDEYTPRSITRRIIAVFVVGTTVLHLTVAIVLAILGALKPVMVNGVNAWDKSLEITLGLIGQEVNITMIIVFFYFGYYGAVGVVQAVKKDPTC
jgi:hypothetical protein